MLSAGFAAITRFFAPDRIPISFRSLSAVLNPMQYLDLAIVPVASVSWQQNRHLLGSESNPDGENRYDRMKAFTCKAFNPRHRIEAGRP